MVRPDWSSDAIDRIVAGLPDTEAQHIRRIHSALGNVYTRLCDGLEASNLECEDVSGALQSFGTALYDTLEQTLKLAAEGQERSMRYFTEFEQIYDRCAELGSRLGISFDTDAGFTAPLDVLNPFFDEVLRKIDELGSSVAFNPTPWTPSLTEARVLVVGDVFEHYDHLEQAIAKGRDEGITHIFCLGNLIETATTTAIRDEMRSIAYGPGMSSATRTRFDALAQQIVADADAVIEPKLRRFHAIFEAAGVPYLVVPGTNEGTLFYGIFNEHVMHMATTTFLDVQLAGYGGACNKTSNWDGENDLFPLCAERRLQTHNQDELANFVSREQPKILLLHQIPYPFETIGTPGTLEYIRQQTPSCVFGAHVQQPHFGQWLNLIDHAIFVAAPGALSEGYCAIAELETGGKVTAYTQLNIIRNEEEKIEDLEALIPG